jgi:hypothetical protein
MEVDDRQVTVRADGVPSPVAVVVAGGKVADDVHGFHRVGRTQRLDDEIAFFVGAVGDLVGGVSDCLCRRAVVAGVIGESLWL